MSGYHRLIAQDPAIGKVGQILQGISTLAESTYTEFGAAVAYASLAGCQTLASKIEDSGSSWSLSRKSWLISIDYGRTEPEALELLASLPNSKVRIPNGTSVIRTPGLFPNKVFHPKLYFLANVNSQIKTFGLFVGSANLTFSGLVTGYECGVLKHWTSSTHPRTQTIDDEITDTRVWFRAMWQNADDLVHVLGPYKKVWRKQIRLPSEDDSKLVNLYRGAGTLSIDGIDALRMANAKVLWVETGTLYKNRGHEVAGCTAPLKLDTKSPFFS